MKLILHIGIHKTGTTAIQHFLYENRKILLNKFKILYPENGIDFGKGHAGFAFALQKENKRTDLENIVKGMLSEIEFTEPKTVIISSEEFYPVENLYVLKNFSQDLFKDIEIVIYLNRQDLWLESAYKQMIKVGKRKIIFTFNPWMEIFSYKQRLFFEKLLSKWQEAFPEAKIIPRIYDRKKFPEGNVILDFLSVSNLYKHNKKLVLKGNIFSNISLKIKINNLIKKETNIIANPSLSHQSTLALRKINAEYELPNEYHSKIVNYLIELDKKEGSKIKTFMTLEERKELLEEYRESNEKLFKEWFNTENQFVLTEEEIEFYKEQDKIPEEEKERAIEERYEKITEYIKTNIPDYDKYRYGIKTIPNLTIKSKEIPSIRGHVDKIDKSITGWAIDIEKKQPLTLILKINNKPIKETKTEIKRAGITKTIGEEIPVGFEISWKEIELPEELKNLPEETKCTIRVVEKEKGIVLPGNYKEITIGEIKKQKEDKNPYIKYNWENINKYFEHFHIDQFLIKEGKATIGGLACLKKEIEKNYKLKIRDEEGIKEIKWGINSPVYGEKNPDNPHAKRARFLGKDIKLGKINEIMLVDDFGNEYNLLKILS